MLMQYNHPGGIKDPQWYLVELRSERTAGPTLRRIGKLIHSTFEDTPVEVFTPISVREHESFEIQSDCYIFVHCDAYDKVKSLKGVIGVASILTDEVSHKPLKVDNDYVQEVIAKAEKAFTEARLRIQLGSFVRVLDGDSRDYCGTVQALHDGRADVSITLKGRNLLLDTPVGNLISLDHVPEALRVYYYCELVKEYAEELKDHAEGRLDLDRQLSAKALSLPPALPPHSSKKHRSRHETVTALIRRLISEGERGLVALADASLLAIHEDRVKRPRTAHILYSIIKKNVVEALQGDGQQVKNFRDVLKAQPDVEFSLEWLIKRAEGAEVKFGGDNCE